MSSNRFALALLTVLPVGAFAQSDAHDCNPSPEFSRIYDGSKNSADRARVFRDALAEHPDSLFLNRWLITGTGAKAGAFEAEYKKKLDEHSGEPLYLFLYAEAIAGKDTPRSIELLREAVSKDPHLVQAHAVLADLYSAQNFRDPEKLAAALRSYFAQCPGEGGPYQYLISVEDMAVLRELAPLWRKAVEGHATAPVVRNYPRLWTVELRAAGQRLTPEFREQVRKDMDRIRQLDPNNTDESRALTQGYLILGEEESARKLEAKAEAKTYSAARAAWQRAHTPTNGPDSPEYLAATDDWVKRFPDDAQAWDDRLTALAKSTGPSKPELDKAGDGLLAANARKPAPWSYRPVSLRVAQAWIASDIRAADCARLAAQSLDELNHQPATGDDRFPGVPGATPATRESRLSFARTQAYTLEVEAYRKLRQFDAAQTALSRMKTWLDTNPADAASARNLYHLASAELAEAKGDKAAALDAYGRVWRSESIRPRALALWRDLGRPENQFDAWWATPNATLPRD